ncbi:MAG TPA: zinc ABC transporter substrate-binding protein [Candidatus Margulisiibacteriota bacterium]|nr:zinc ABC transporter substrate-binding protein [Candidatus Margulisiibacteriota bacterium]
MTRIRFAHLGSLLRAHSAARFVLLAAFAFAATPSHGAESAPAAPLKVGVTLHPYYSWTANVAKGTDVEVRPILPGEVDAGDYQPRPQDIAKIADLDAIVVNGVGHDDFIFDMIKASGNTKVQIIRPNENVPLLKAANGGTVNSHTFISFSNAIAQTYAIAKALGALRPQQAETFQKNAAAYVQRLRAMKSKAAAQLVDAKVNRVVTVHDGYGYLMQEFGIEIAGVVEPAHGLVPSAKELGAMVDLLQRENVHVVFAEETFPQPLLQVLREEGHARIYIISHIASGSFTPGRFEAEMQKNVDAMIKALVTDPRS